LHLIFALENFVLIFLSLIGAYLEKEEEKEQAKKMSYMDILRDMVNRSAHPTMNTQEKFQGFQMPYCDANLQPDYGAQVPNMQFQQQSYENFGVPHQMCQQVYPQGVEDVFEGNFSRHQEGNQPQLWGDFQDSNTSYSTQNDHIAMLGEKLFEMVMDRLEEGRKSNQAWIDRI